ncbi:MAG: hypothetical protein IPN58_04580 [Anaerolineales bacterium]|nr:hypothetical protein [Anaerolineales bacterium]
MNKLPLRVTLLLLMVLSLTTWNALRLWTSLAWQNVLNEFSVQPSPTVTAGSGAFLGNYRYHSRLEHFAEKSMGHETADRGRSKLHRLVLGRAVRLAKSASKLVIRCYSKSGSNYFHPVQYKNIVERGL